KNENQRFEILLRLRDFDAAFKAANSPIKFQKLGREYLAQQSLEMAAKCFHAAGDLKSLLLVDSFGKGEYLKEIGALAAQRGEHNVAFVAHFKAGNYAACSELIRDTPFGRTFAAHYCVEK
ncbi:hypothetical protein PAPHI01_2809, partial [Pancytospora philotis]